MAFSTTRHGGVSEGNYGEMNINRYCGDSEEHVEANMKALCRELGISTDRLVMPHQVHGIESRMIADEFFALPAEIRTMLLDNTDCVMTDQAGACIGVSTADCVPVLLYDEEHHAAAAVHAGWRGTLNRIAHKAVVEMHRCYKSDPAKVKAVIGPAISVRHFEVGQELYDQFSQLNNDMDRIAEMHDKWHLNLPLCNELQLEDAGVLKANIQQSGICTWESVADYFSARRLGQDSGRIYTAIILK